MGYTTAIYLRLSVDDDNRDESNSIKSQRDLLRDFTAADPVLSSGDILEFSDDGWSGTTFERPRVKELLDLARRGGVQCIVVKDLSRWGRNYIEVIEYIEHIFPFLGIRFVSVNERYDSEDFKGSTAPTDIAFNSIMHDIYCKELSFKVRQSYVAKAQKGEFLCGEAPFGFVKSETEKNKLIIDAEAALVVRRIFDMACGGMGTVRIAAELNGGGVETPLMYRRRMGRALRGGHSAVRGDGIWTDNSVRKILTDERYIGTQVSGKTRKPKPGSRRTICLPESEWIKVPGTHEAVVSDEVFKRANAGIKRFAKTNAAPKRQALFAGKVRCGHCNRALRYVGGTVPSHYCEAVRLGISVGCSDDKVYVEDLKAAALAAVKAEAGKVFDALAKRKQSNREALSGRASIEAEIKQLTARIALLERRGLSLYEDFADGRLGRDGYVAAKDACAAELSGAQARFAELTERLGGFEDKPEMPGDEPLLRRMLDAEDVTDEVLALVDCVTVYDAERIEIKFAFGDMNVMEELKQNEV